MVAVLLALLGVPLWLVVGMLLGSLYTRRQYRRTPGVFRCHGRVIDGHVSALDNRWGRTPAYGRWVHDVLLISRGLALIRFAAVPVADLVTGPTTRDGIALRGLGDTPVVLTVRTDDGATVELAAAERDELMLAGPFAGSSGPSRRPPADR